MVGFYGYREGSKAAAVLPAGHIEQGAPPVLVEPAGQAVHVLANTDENDPAGQAVHTDEPARANEPDERDNTEVKWFSIFFK